MVYIRKGEKKKNKNLPFFLLEIIKIDTFNNLRKATRK